MWVQRCLQKLQKCWNSLQKLQTFSFLCNKEDVHLTQVWI